LSIDKNRVDCLDAYSISELAQLLKWNRYRHTPVSDNYVQRKLNPSYFNKLNC